jgi:hypothetical protein
MKSALLSDIERGFEALKAKLDFAPKVTSLENDLISAKDEVENIKKS